MSAFRALKFKLDAGGVADGGEVVGRQVILLCWLDMSAHCCVSQRGRYDSSICQIVGLFTGYATVRVVLGIRAREPLVLRSGDHPAPSAESVPGADFGVYVYISIYIYIYILDQSVG